MKIQSTICFVFLLCMDCSAQNTLSDISKTADNALKVINLFTGDKSDIEPESVTRLDGDKSQKINNSSQKKKVCKELCVENLNKKNAKVEIEFQDTNMKQTLLVMSRDRSCLFDLPLGIYTVSVFFEDKLTKKSDYRIEDPEQESIRLPE